MEGSTTATTLSGIVTTDLVGGVLDEVVGLLPAILPAMITFVGIRKGVSFVLNMLHSA